MNDIQEIVNAKVKLMSDDGSIQEAIEKGVEESIRKAIKNQFDSYGSVAKQIEKSIQDGLQINIKDLPFESYNEQMLVAVKTKMGQHFSSKASSKFMEEIDKTLAPVPQEMTINEFVNTIASMWKTDEPWDADDLDDYATVEFKGGHGDKSYSLSMWKQKESGYLTKRENSANLDIYFIDGKIRINHRHRYNPTCFSEHEAFVFKLYAADTVITGIDEFDADDCDLALKEFEH